MSAFWVSFVDMFGNIFGSLWNFLFSSSMTFYGISFGSIIISLIFFSILITFFFKG